VLLERDDILRCYLGPVVVAEESGKAVEMGFDFLFRLRIINMFFPHPLLDQRREGGRGFNRGANGPFSEATG
jgi:hypothetical protein